MIDTVASIRHIKEDEIPILWSHCRALAAHHGADQSFQLTQASLRDAYLSGTIHAIVSADESHLAGSAIFSKTYSTWTGRHNFFLEHLYVNPSHRGQGHGRAMLLFLQSLVDGRVEWSVQGSNVKSLTFYKDLGAQVHEGWVEMRLENQNI